MCNTEGYPNGLKENFGMMKAEKSLGKSGWFGTSGNTRWSRSTRSQFGSFSN